MLKEIIIAFQSFRDAHEFIRKNNLWAWVLLPGIIYTLLFFTGMYFFWTTANDNINWLSAELKIENWLQQQSSPLLSFFFLMAGLVLRLILFCVYFSFFKYLMLIIGSPLFALLSEKIESILQGKPHEIDWNDIRKHCWRSIRMSLRNAGWQLVYLMALVVLALVPIVGWITPIIAILMDSYYYGFTMLDHSLAREPYTPSQSIHFLGRHKGLAIGNGIVFYIMHLVIPYAPAYAITAGNFTIHKVKN